MRTFDLSTFANFVGVIIVIVIATGCGNLFDPFGCENRAALSLSDVALADSTVGQAYDQPLPEDHSKVFSNVAVGAGQSLPPGLSLDGTEFAIAHLKGTPTTPGDYAFKLDAQEPGTQCEGRKATFGVSLHVDAAH